MLPFSDPFHALFRCSLPVVDIIFDFRRIDHGKKGLVGLECGPLFGVIEWTLVHKVEIKLPRSNDAISNVGNIGRIISHILKSVCHRPNPIRKSVIILTMGSHIMGVCGCLIHTRHKRGTTWCTNRTCGKHMGVEHPISSQRIKIRSGDKLFTINSQIQIQILPHNPDNVGLL